MKANLEDYPETDLFRVVDSVGVPHPFVITPHHVTAAADHFSGMLGPEAIAYAARKGHGCGLKGCLLSYADHKQGLLIEVYSPRTLQELEHDLRAYLKTIIERAEKDGFVGFAFKQAEGARHENRG